MSRRALATSTEQRSIFLPHCLLWWSERRSYAVTSGLGFPSESDRAELTRLVVENDDLDRLEALLSEFNLFEAIGAVRRELRHSDVLAFLLDPTAAHGLNDTFLRRLLQRALARAEPGRFPITPVELDVAEMEDSDVRREWGRIDVFVLDKRNQLAVILENKIDTGEHADQLRRYWEHVAHEHPNFKVVGLYLTPDGEPASDPNYISVDYRLIAELVDDIVTTRVSVLGPDVRVLLAHYSQLLKRYIVTDSEIADLCRRIYRKHRRAMDLILEYRPDPQEALKDAIERLVNDSPELVLDDSLKRYIYFIPRQWDVPLLREGSGWTRSRRMLLFEFKNESDRLQLRLYIGPGPTQIRQQLHEASLANAKAFPKAGKTLNEKWARLYARDFVVPKDFEDEDEGTLTELVQQRWSAFKTQDLPAMLSAFGTLDWLSS